MAESDEAKYEELKYEIRELRPADMALVLETWVGTFRTSKYAGVIPNNEYKRITSECIRQLVARGSRGFVATDTDNPASVLGYVIAERTRLDEPVIHYCWVREGKRHQGIGTALRSKVVLPADKFFYTFRTAACKSSVFCNGAHEPAIARRRMP